MAILGCALVFFALAIRKAERDIRASGVQTSWESIDWMGLLMSVCCGCLALFPACVAWQKILRDFDQRIDWWNSVYAYFLGHFGKYVPGKAMAILLRVSELHRHRVLVKPAIVSVFIETLTSVASGAILGAVFLQFVQVPRWLQLAALAGIPFAFVALIPQPFRWLLRKIASSRLGEMPTSVVEAIDGRLMTRTVCYSWLGWMLHGTSLWFVLRSIVQPGMESYERLNSFNGWVVCVASMSLGAVAGFLSMLPGGAFARELASTWILSTLLPQPIALLGTVVSRLTSLASEAIAIGGSKAIQLWWSSSGQRSSDRIRAEGMRVDRDDATDG